MVTRHRVASLGDIAPGTLKRVEVGGVLVCLARTEDGGLHAINDVCTHEHSSLSEGTLEGVEVECPTHSSLFDVRSGAVTSPPATTPVASYATVVVGEDVFVEIEP